MKPVVTGAGVLCSIASDVDEFTAALRAGKVGERLEFDFATACGANPRVSRLGARAPRPVQASLAVALQAWTAAGLDGVPPDRIGLVVGGQNLTSRLAEVMFRSRGDHPAHVPPSYALRFLDSDHVGVVSAGFGITGEGCLVGGASATGNVAVITAARLIATGELDACLVVGALTELSMLERQAFANLGVLSPGDCRPFDAQRRGFVPGEGSACLVLESPGYAAQRGAKPLASIEGWSIRLDANSLADPSLTGEVTVMREAIQRAGLTPNRIGYVNAHGTGSRLGDETEALALREVFGAARPWVNSTKGLTGHCLSAAGVVEAVATVVQLREGFVHPNAGLHDPIADLRFPRHEAEPAEHGFALSNGFGFGGFNTSVVFGR